MRGLGDAHAARPSALGLTTCLMLFSSCSSCSSFLHLVTLVRLDDARHAQLGAPLARLSGDLARPAPHLAAGVNALFHQVTPSTPNGPAMLTLELRQLTHATLRLVRSSGAILAHGVSRGPAVYRRLGSLGILRAARCHSRAQPCKSQYRRGSRCESLPIAANRARGHVAPLAPAPDSNRHSGLADHGQTAAAPCRPRGADRWHRCRFAAIYQRYGSRLIDSAS